MKSYTNEFQAYLSQSANYLPCCWRITRADGVVVGLTEFDRPLIIDGITYQADGGILPSDVDRGLETQANQVTLVSYFSDSIPEADIVRGAFDNARVFVFRVNPYALPDSFDSPYQYEPLVSGRLGRFTLTDLGYTVEARGLQDALQTKQGEVTSKTCRNQFCDSVCGLNIASYTETATVDTVSNSRFFTTNLSRGDNYFLGGKLTWLTGDNAGQTGEVIYSNGTTIRLLNPPPFPIVSGDTADIERACDKTFTTCRTIFGNGVNFQGEPGLPGQDELSKRADQ
jgi:uncharacterized phage protein (TIGR02218 family)